MGIAFWFVIVMMAVIALNMLLAATSVGKSRKPIDATTAAIASILYLVELGGLLYVAIQLH